MLGMVLFDSSDPPFGMVPARLRFLRHGLQTSRFFTPEAAHTGIDERGLGPG